MSLFEALYRKGCINPMSWDSLVNKIVIGTELIKQMEWEIVKILQNLMVALDRQEIYAESGTDLNGEQTMTNFCREDY